MRRFIAYYRVSTEEQKRNNFSLSTQRKLVHEYAKRNGLLLVTEREESHSGWTPSSRPQFADSVRQLESDATIEGIIVSRIDRLARNLTDGANILENLKRVIVSVNEGEIDPSVPGSVFQFNILLSTSKHYSDQLSGRVKRGMQARAEQGYFLGVRPLGYLADDSVKPSSTKLDPARAHLIQELFEETASKKLDLDAATAWAKTRGLRTRKGRVPARSEIHFILTNPAYYGMVRTKHGLYSGKHTPLISEQLFNRVQDTLRRRISSGSLHRNPFKGILTCADCGRPLTLTEKAKAGKTYRYQHCPSSRTTCTRPTFSERKLSDSLVSVLRGIQISPEIESMLQALVAESQAEFSEYRRARNAKVVALKAEAQAKEDQKHTALRMHLSNLIDQQEYNRTVAELDEEIAVVTSQIDELRSTEDPRFESITELFELMKRAPALYMKQDDEERARMLRVVTSNCEVTAESIVPTYRKPFSGIAEGLETGEWWACLDSNQGPPAYQASALTS